MFRRKTASLADVPEGMTVPEYVAELRKDVEAARDTAWATMGTDAHHEAFIAYCRRMIRWAKAVPLLNTPRGLAEQIDALEDRVQTLERDRGRLAAWIAARECLTAEEVLGRNER